MTLVRGHSIKNTGRTRFRKGFIPWNKGLKGYNKNYPRNEKWKNNISEGKKNSLKSRLASRKAAEVLRRRNIGSKRSNKIKMKMSIAQSKIDRSGSKSNLWRGGISNIPYPVDWSATLRRSIRERDKYTCVMCMKQQTSYAFPVHHIDYNKNNCNPNNLVTLCRSCHAITTNSNREYWINYFNK